MCKFFFYKFRDINVSFSLLAVLMRLFTTSESLVVSSPGYYVVGDYNIKVESSTHENTVFCPEFELRGTKGMFSFDSRDYSFYLRAPHEKVNKIMIIKDKPPFCFRESTPLLEYQKRKISNFVTLQSRYKLEKGEEVHVSYGQMPQIDGDHLVPCFKKTKT